MTETPGKSLLFVCTHNSARSQMAEGLLRHRYGDRYAVASAGTTPTGVHPLAVAAMREIGVDISAHRSTTVAEVTAGRAFDVVVTVCDAAKESCPFVPATERTIHQSFPDPSSASGTEEERLQAFRSVRDAIATWINETFAA